MMIFKYVSDQGEIVEVIPEKFTPLTYSDLVANGGSAQQYAIEVFAKSIKLPNGRDEGPGTASFPITFRQPLTIYSLVEGGWLPPPFVLPANYLVDRNVIRTFVRIREDSSKRELAPTHWWLQSLEGFPILINPVLYASEGANQRTPSFQEFLSDLEEGSAEIKTFLPNAKLTEFAPKDYAAIYSVVTDSLERQKREVEFLLTTAPRVVDRVSRSHLLGVESQVLAAAKKLNLKAESLCVLAVLSCLYEKPDGSGFKAARGIIKPKKAYTSKKAYNAVSDLRALEFFLAALGMEREPFSLCTCDKALAAFWCGLNAHSAKWETNSKFGCTISVNEQLFPRLSPDELKELAQRISDRAA
jgi:hypothetical protein